MKLTAETITILKNYAAINQNIPIVVEVELATLGHWVLHNEDNPDGKFINYHAGPAPEVNLREDYPILDESNSDPLFVLNNYKDREDLLKISKDQIAIIEGEF
mgnify:CR=1 FL=1